MLESLPDERWLPVPGYEGLYEISDHGRVYSLPRLVQSGPRLIPRGGLILKAAKGSRDDGHPVVGLSRDAKRRTIRVHTLVLTAFVGPCPHGMECLHWDDDPTHNHLSNLRWGTRSENTHDKVRNGRHPQANKTACSNGHDFTPENTRIRRDGTRQCITCMVDRTREWRKQRREQKTKELQWVS